MAAPFTDNPNPYTVLSSEQPAADNVAVASSPNASSNSSELRAGEVIPGDVAGFQVPGAEQPGQRQGGGAGGFESLGAGADSVSEATTSNDSPLLSMAAAVSGAEMEASARSQQLQGQAAHEVGGATAPGRGDDGGGGFEPVHGGIGAARQAAEARGVGTPPAVEETAAAGVGGGVGDERAAEAEVGGGGGKLSAGLMGSIGQAVSAVSKGLAGLMSSGGGGGGGGEGHDQSGEQQRG
ncbi:hypothetical protein GPECTOR_5g96 [Gonium pectorale]|uniref:Uncharacterized protein n=1 Tax=Gonium pectorale TaxID=33097 RepID=A0A150GX99_GONPE|nr:hypothetical protein GPECTOR_5g96 [Gonium pectorale]|eukprot:KXZ54444.1 hypothetical protein GPECTOR_5g96 [Gonium pectorale]